MSCGYSTPCTTCKSCEAFCQTNRNSHSYTQNISSMTDKMPYYRMLFDEMPLVEPDDIIIKTMPRDKWRQLMVCINWFASYGSTQSSKNQWGMPVITPDDELDKFGGNKNNFLHAETINLIVQYLNDYYQCGIGIKKERDDIIYARDIKHLVEKFRKNAKVSYYACDQCNTTCNNPAGCVGQYLTGVSCSNCWWFG